MTGILQKFIEIKSGKDNSQKNAWLEHCRLKKIPYIIVTTRTKQASIEWDYISYPADVESHFENNKTLFHQELKNIYGKYAKANSKFSISSTSAYIENLSIEDARRAASDIYDLVASSI